MTQRTRNIVTILTFAGVTATAGVILRFVLLFLMAEQFTSILAWVLIGSVLIAIFAKQRWLWTVFIVAVLLYAFISSGTLANSFTAVWGIATLICGIGGTIFLRRPLH